MSCPRLCDDRDLTELCPQLDLWLKPHSKLTITVTLPTLRCGPNSGPNSGQCIGQCISTWEVMDKLKKRIKPLKLKSLKVIKSNLDLIRFEGECDSQISLTQIESKLNKVSLKLSGFSQELNVKTGRIKIGSTRHEWESFFRDNPNMNEMKAGYRPDTIHLQSLPVKWFGGERPNPNLLVKVFATFGDIRRFHIPVLDINEEEDTFKRFSFNESLSFEAYVQYRDYIGFVKAMDALRGMKLVKKLSELTNQKNQYLEYDIKVDFDKTKHLSDKSIKKRRIAREYGIKSAVDLKNLREETKRQRERYQSRVDLLKARKESAKCALQYLLSLAQMKAKAKKQVEDTKCAQQKFKERLLSEEIKLREKLLERRREHLRLQSKGKLKSVANIGNNNNNDNNDYTFNNSSNKSIQSSKVNFDSSHNRNNNNLISVHSYSNPFGPKNYLEIRRNQYYNQINTNSLYKNHKKSCKFYKPRSIVIKTNHF